MSTQLYQAHRQWKTRPADQRFTTLADLKASVLARRNISREGIQGVQRMKIVQCPIDNGSANDIGLDVGGPRPLDFTNWSFGQLCTLVKAPAPFITTLPPALVESTMNFKISEYKGDELKVLLTADGGHYSIRAMTSRGYGRIWDIDLCLAVERILERNPFWHNPPAYKGGRFGGPTEPAGLYASDRDVFIFMIDDEHKIQAGVDAAGNPVYLNRGFMMWNSEVGKTSYGIMTFLFNVVCNNHIIWGAQEVREIRIRHSSQAPALAYMKILPKLKSYIQSSARMEETVIANANQKHIADDKDGMMKWLSEKGFTKAEAKDAWEFAETEEADPTTLWSIVQGLTASARGKEHTDVRVDLERRAGKLLDLVA